jgi:hypothetical protein
MKSARILLSAVALLSLPAVPQTEVAARELSRQEIRQMPITNRPSRPGHFYGNSVRRAQSRRSR